MTQRDMARLAAYERRYRELAQKLSEIGWIASGSLAERTERCGKAYCACASDPARRHGPYWHFTAKIDGKTVNKRLSERAAHLYEDWIANDRTVRSLLTEMREVAAKAQALMLADEASDRSRQGPRRPSPETRQSPDRQQSRVVRNAR
ncbi:MAG: hypothetical protein M0Z95_08080 [Actinomycetota bacterium]|nr:hypothetical protein [Actinomycetota bacterium]